MSHFCVFVITDYKPTEKDIEEILMPWHEYECTGIENEYVIEEDITEEARSEYEDRAADQDITFAEWVKDWYGGEYLYPGQERTAKHKYICIEMDRDDKVVRVINRTNPNKKWDWWQIGGRWTGHLSNYDPENDPRNQESCIYCNGTGMRNDSIGKDVRAKDPDYTCNGCQGRGIATKWPTEWVKHDFDIIQKKDIPFDDFMNAAGEEAAVKWDKVHSIIGGRVINTWSECLQKCENNFNEARAVYNNQPAVVDIRSIEEFKWDDLESYLVDKETFVRRRRAMSVSPFAFVVNGEWHERGSMGWFASVSDEMDIDDWHNRIDELLNSIDNEAWFTVVDCHI